MDLTGQNWWLMAYKIMIIYVKAILVGVKSFDIVELLEKVLISNQPTTIMGSRGIMQVSL